MAHFLANRALHEMTLAMRSILLIDDDVAVRLFVEHSLKEMFNVYSFRSWRKAFDCISSNKIDLFLLDVKLSGLQGNEIANMIRDQTGGKIILFSSMDIEELKKLAETCNADGYIPKVLDREILLRDISVYLPATADQQ